MVPTPSSPVLMRSTPLNPHLHVLLLLQPLEELRLALPAEAALVCDRYRDLGRSIAGKLPVVGGAVVHVLIGGGELSVCQGMNLVGFGGKCAAVGWWRRYNNFPDTSMYVRA